MSNKISTWLIKISQKHDRLISLMDQGIISAANFLFFILLAKYMKLEEFGIIVLGFSIAQFLSEVLMSLTATVLNISGSRMDRDKYINLFLNISIIQISQILIVAVLLYFIFAIVSIVDQEHLINQYLLFISFYLWIEYYRKSFYSRSEFIVYALLISVTRYLVLLVPILFMIMNQHELTIDSILFYLILSLLISSSLGLFFLIKNIFKRKKISIESIRLTVEEHWSFSRWTFKSSILQSFVNNSYSWMIVIILGLEAVGVYRAITQLVNIMNPLRQAVMNYLPAKASLLYAENGMQGLKLAVDTIRKGYLYPVLVLSLLILIFSEEIIYLVYQDKFDSATYATLIIFGVMAFLTNLTWSVFRILFLAQKRSKVLFINNIYTGILHMILGVIFLYLFKEIGAPISQIFVSIIGIVLLQRSLKNPEKLFR